MRKLALILMLVLAPAAANAATLTVALDQAVRITLKAPAQDVIVGNPAIADVTVADSHHLVVVGKTYGVTNLLVVSDSGRTVFDRQVIVGASSEGRVSIYRGPFASHYACSPDCEVSSVSAAAPVVTASPLAPTN